MTNSSTRRLAIFAITSCFGFALAQTRSTGLNQDELALYTSLFHQVAQLKDVSRPIALNGKPTNLTVLSPKIAIGLTEEESQALNSIAGDCEERLRQFDEQSRPSMVQIGRATFDARIQNLAGEDSTAASEQAQQQLQNLANQQDRIVADHMVQLRAALREDRFKVLDAWVHARQQEKSFFPLIPAQN